MEEERVDVSRDLSYRSFTPVSIVCFEAGEIIRLDTKSVGTISGEVRGKREGKKKKKKKREGKRGKKRTFLLHYLENYFSGVWKSIAATITTGERVVGERANLSD